MNKDLKKKILITTELASSEVGVFLKNQGFEFEHFYNEDSEYQFIVNNVCPDIKNIPRMQIFESLSVELEPFICGRINKEMFSSEQGRALLSSYFEDALEFNLIERYSKVMSNIYSIKIHDFLNIGYFVDSIIIEAYKAKFDISALRVYLNKVLSLAFKKVELSSYKMPVEVAYSHNGEAFAVQVSLVCDEWNGNLEIQNDIDELTKTINYFDTTHFAKTDRLTFSALIFKNADLRDAKASFFTEIFKRSPESEIKQTGALGIYSGLVFNEPVRYQSAKKPVIDPAMKLFIARKFAHFIKNYKLKVEYPKIPYGKLQVSDIVSYLAHYPIQKDLEEIDSEVKHLIFKLLTNNDFSNNVDGFVQNVMDSSPYAVAREMHKIMGDRGLENVESIMAEQSTKLEVDFINRVKGSAETNSGSDFQRISSSGQENYSDNEVWGILPTTVFENDESNKWGVHGLNQSENISKKEKLEADFSKIFFNEQVPSDAIKNKLESQVDRMKKIMYQLKNEIIRLKSEKNLNDEMDRENSILENQNIFGMLSDTESSFGVMKNKEIIIEKMKNNFTQFIKRKDQIIEELENKVAAIENELATKNEILSNEKIEALENENKILSFKLELAGKKVSVISEKMENKVTEVITKREREISSLKSNLKLALAVINKFKIERSILENENKEDLDSTKKSREEIAYKNSLQEKDETIQALSADRKDMEEKYKIQHIELKKAEQKLKYTLAQLDSANRKKPGSSAGNKSVEAYIKQLDQASVRMAELTAEVVEKRRDIVKMKQENTMFLTKIAELEKKIGFLDKKAA